MLDKNWKVASMENTVHLTNLDWGWAATLGSFVSIWTPYFFLQRTPEQIELACAFSSHSTHLRTPSFLSDLHTAAPHIVTRPWPNWFLFSFNIPWSLLSCQPPGTKLQKGLREKKRQSPHSAGKHKSLLRRPPIKKFLFEAIPKGQNNKCRFNWDSPHGQKGQNVTFWQPRSSWRDKLIYRSGNKAGAACVQRGRKGLSARPWSPVPARAPSHTKGPL